MRRPPFKPLDKVIFLRRYGPIDHSFLLRLIIMDPPEIQHRKALVAVIMVAILPMMTATNWRMMP